MLIEVAPLTGVQLTVTTPLVGLVTVTTGVAIIVVETVSEFAVTVPL